MSVRGRRSLGVVIALLLSLVATGCTDDDPTQPAVLEPLAMKHPLNVVVLLADDMDDFSCAETATYMPESSPWLHDQGRCYENATVSSPVCCPSRAVMQTGQLNHNNGVRTQKDARKLRVPTSMQRLLTRAGLATYGTGKLYNGVKAWDYESGDLESGFAASDFWQRTNYYGYKLWSEEKQKPLRPTDDVHTTVRTGDFTTAFLDSVVDQPGNFYAYAGFKAPHTQNLAGEGVLRFPVPTPANAERPVPPMRWNPERDTSDKLEIFSQLDHGRRYFAKFNAARVRAFYDVDQQMARVLQLLEDAGRLDDTVVVFTSDNGFQLGSNGWEGKSIPYRDSLEVPLLIRYPDAFEPGSVDRRRVGLVDIAPTVYDLLGITAPHVLDGHSLLSDASRRSTFHEFTNEKSKLVADESGEEATHVPSWATYRIGDRAYVEYYGRSGEVLQREFYTDRDEKQNLLAPEYAAQRPSEQVLARFERLLTAARTCAGTEESGADNPCP